MTHAHDDLLFAKYQGFYEYLVDGPDTGRSHVQNQDWNVAYDEGRSEAEALNGPEGQKPYSLPEINAWMDEDTYRRVSGLIGEAASLVGDGQGQELGRNTEYERGIAELILRCAGLSSDHLDQVVEAIHATARESKPLEQP